MPPPPNGHKTALGLGFRQFVDCFFERKAFTLAEVLITLVIIGVIAALTIPNLMQSYKKHQVEAGVKEAYSILSNAIKLSEIENGDVAEWDFSNLDEITNTKLYPYLKIGREGTGLWNFNTFYPNCKRKELDGATVNTGWSTTHFADFENGMSIGLYNGLHSYGIILIYIDIDGFNKGSGTLGKDVFEFTLAKKDFAIETYKQGTYKQTLIPGRAPQYNNPVMDYSLEQLLGTTIGGSCNLNARADHSTSFKGSQCSAVIAKNGWKIPDNYPVKKW